MGHKGQVGRASVARAAVVCAAAAFAAFALPAAAAVVPLADAAEPPRSDPAQQEIKEWFLENYFGRAPVGRPSDMEFKGNDILIGGAKVAIRLTVSLPPGASKQNPCPAIVFADRRSCLPTPVKPEKLKYILAVQEEFRRLAIERGCAFVMWNANDVAPDCWLYDRYVKAKPGELPPGAWGVFGLYGGEPDGRAGDTWGTIRAWAWGHSRVMDWIETRPEIDAKRVAVCGHSRLGKAALVAGATDERFLVAYSNCSGVGGAHPHRLWKPGVCKLSYVNKHHLHWLCLNSRKFEADERNIPHDMDEFLALMAPRYLYVASASEDAWAGPDGEQYAAKAASRAWERMGLKGMCDRGHVGGHVRQGAHDFTPYDFKRFLDFCATPFGTPALAQRIVFNWHNFLSSCSTWDAEDWHGWIERAQADGYNAVMVHAYGNNPMAAFSFNGKERDVGRLATSADGRDWSTMHVNDVRRLVGGEAFDSAVFGSRAAAVPDAERANAARALMRQAFADAASRKMGVYFAVDLDTASGSPQELIATLPERARLKSKAGLWLANPDAPEGYAYYKSAVDCWMDSYPQITTLAVWMRVQDSTPWLSLSEKDLPKTWQKEYAAALAEAVVRHPETAKSRNAPGIFAYMKVVRAVERALKERGSTANVAVGVWNFKNMAQVDAFIPDGVTLMFLDYNIIGGKPDLADPDVRRKLAEMSRRHPVVPVVWAQHDDRHFIGRPYKPYDNLGDMLSECNAAGFGVIHWMTRPLDFFLFASARQVVPGAKKETLSEMCDVFAAERLKEPELGPYLREWTSNAPIFGRDTTDFFIDRPLAPQKDAVIAGCRKRLKMLEGKDGANAAYFRGLEKFCIAFYEAQAKYEESVAAFKRGDLAAARDLIAAAKPEDAIRIYASLADGRLTKGEKGVLISLNTKWLVYFHQMRQMLGLEPVRIKFGETRHEPLAQMPGRYTYFIDKQGRMWQTLGTRETGAERIFAALDAADEIGRIGIASGKPFTVKVDLMAKPKDGARLQPGDYVLRLLLFDIDAMAIAEGRRVFKVAAGDGAAVTVDTSKLAGGANRLAEVEIPVAVKKAGPLVVSFTPVEGDIIVSGLVLSKQTSERDNGFTNAERHKEGEKP